VFEVGYNLWFVRRTDLSYNWQNRWFFTDFGSHCIFFGLLMVMMYLWKPNERSKEYAFSIQLDSKGGVSMGNPADIDTAEVEGEEFQKVEA
jgi:hypothetical protein